MKLSLIFQVFCGASLLVSAPLTAATYIVTYTGFIDNSYDFTDTFRGSTGNLNGLSYTSTYTIISPLAGASSYSDGTESYTQGGSLFSGPSPVSATITINGVTRAVSGATKSIAYQRNGIGLPGGTDLVEHIVEDGAYATSYYGRINDNIYSYTNDFLATHDFRVPLNYNFQSNDISGGDFSFYNSIDYTFGRLRAKTVSIALVSNVPEPKTWAMMIGGFGAIGVTMRSRRRMSTLRVV